ncbi:hypothetical protein R1sor_017137 [Riccia sorocarpa]|uniref:Uncharacterized protein n=1 Tax=Riccia sorocarpa TaxID=122646 RepID=A0ABD3I9J4_9MARC
MVRTKQTVRKSTGGKPPDPRLGQWLKDMCKAGETSLNNVMDSGDESPTAARSEAEELEVQDMDADPDAHLGHEVEAASEDDDGLELIDMQHMIIHEHRTEHNGTWCIEVDKIFYSHIGNSVFKVNEEMTLFLKVNDKWSPEDVPVFISEFSDDKDFCAVYCEDWNEKSITQSHMYNTGRIASQIVTRAFVVPRPRRIDADDVFEWLTKFEEEKRSGKRKTTTPRTSNNKKKPRPVEAVPEEPFDPMTKFSKKDEKKALKTDFKQYRHMYLFGPSSVYHIPVEKIREAPSPIVLETYAKTHKLNWSEDLILVRALIVDPDVVFLAISGQHSSRAQQLLLLETRVPDDVREQNRHRRSRILNGGFDPTKYHDISYQDNKNNETQVFVSSFVECLNQAMAQWITLRRPKSTQGSTTKNDPFDVSG